jgi:hypothetical protein
MDARIIGTPVMKSGVFHGMIQRSIDGYRVIKRLEIEKKNL